jgi:hypothetical protein
MDNENVMSSFLSFNTMVGLGLGLGLGAFKECCCALYKFDHFRGAELLRGGESADLEGSDIHTQASEEISCSSGRL